VNCGRCSQILAIALCGLWLSVCVQGLAVPQELATDGLPKDASTTARLVQVRLKDNDAQAAVVGRVLVQAVDGGLLLEDQAGRIHQLTPDRIHETQVLEQPFQFLAEDQLAALLLQQTGGGFAIHVTQHFVICSDASERYTEYCGRLLEKVFEEFQQLFADLNVDLQPLAARLPVLIFREAAEFQAYARRQHPETEFGDVPGYYSIRDNQMLITAISGDREFRTHSDVIRELRKRPRQVETIVHEAVHQLAYNTGLQVRYADNPMWLSEGLAVYFEPISGRGALMWNRPGEVSRIHLQGFQQATQDTGLQLPLSELLTSDSAFTRPDTLAAAYAEGWALTWFLLKTNPTGFASLMQQQQLRKPLTTVSVVDRQQEIVQASGLSIAELEAALIQHMSKVRMPR
jgi:hypothetical protein